MRVKLYVECGGDSSIQHKQCREGFRRLLERAGFEKRMPRIMASGSRDEAFDDFLAAVSRGKAQEYPVLLVDSEGPVSLPAWEHLRARDGWTRPNGVDDHQAQLMVQCVETWFVADRGALRAFFGQCLSVSALPPLNGLEGRAKDDVQARLASATRSCGRDRAYAKGNRSCKLLGSLDPGELRRRLPHFVLLCQALEQKLSDG